MNASVQPPLDPSVASNDNSLREQCREIANAAKEASQQLATLDTAIKNRWLAESANALRQNTDRILAANQIDLRAAEEMALSDAMMDRLRLSPERLDGIAVGLEEVAALEDPVGEIIHGFTRPGGLRITKRRVPLGVVFFIYESRPNVTADAAAICVKSGNAVILRGGKEAIHSSRAIVDTINLVGEKTGIPTGAIQLVPTVDRNAVGHFLQLGDKIDVTIPRGGESLIRRVVAEATMPVIKHYDGNCHVYIDEKADTTKAVKVVVNSKCQRMGVCNTCESLLFHESIADSLLPQVLSALRDNAIEIRGCEITRKFFPDAAIATDDDWATEYLGPKISVKVVSGIEEAVRHINHFGSGHTDAIVTESISIANHFCDTVDSSAVMVNASTRFNDGGIFGLGAEIGISTDKFHARGPCGVKELTTTKYVVLGDGHIRH